MPVSGYGASPERIAKIGPEWIRDHIAAQQRHIEYLDKRNRDLEAQLELARGEHKLITTNVRLEAGDIPVALPQDSVVVFQGKFQVSPTANDRDSIDIIHVGNGAMLIMPVQDDEIMVRERRD